jgi:hypothetical protein
MTRPLPSPSLPAARAALALLLVTSLAFAGCAGGPAPGPGLPATDATPTTSPAPPSPEDRQGRPAPQWDDPAPPVPLVEQRIELNGTILLRPAGEPILHTGDAPAFFITLPRGTQAFTAHAEWFPDQVMGLEFHPPGDYGGENANRSWDKAHQLNQQVAPPIDMAIGHPGPGQWHPEPGDWWCYLGPSTVGGGVSWNMTLRFILPEGSAVKLTPSS